MSGHSKWSSIKHQKGVTDARRGQLFTKLTREIIVAVREGGANPETNYRLRLAIQKARDSNMPQDNIQRSIKKASGQAEGASLIEMIMEGYGPNGVAILVQALSDNRNRTLQDVRHIFSRHGGNLGESGSVTWLFEPIGLITVDTNNMDAEEMALEAIDSGAEDVKIENGYTEIHTKPAELEKVRLALEQKNLPITSTELTMKAKTLVKLEEKDALQTLKLLDKLEELDDVQHVVSNADFPEEILESYQAQV